MKKIFVLIIFLSINCRAEFVSGTFDTRKNASSKIRTLISDCMSYKKIDKFTVYFFETPPSDGEYQALYVAKWRSDYGPMARAVVELRWDELNRFNEKVPKSVQCIFHGDNYELGNIFKFPP